MDIEMFYEFVKQNCGLFENGFIKEEIIGAKQIEYSFETSSMPSVLKRYSDGGCLMQRMFAIKTKDLFDAEERKKLSVEKMYNEFSNWTKRFGSEDKNRLFDCGKLMRIDVIRASYVFSAMSELASYCIQCCVVYEKKFDISITNTESMMKSSNMLMYYGLENGKKTSYVKMSNFTKLVTEKNPMEQGRFFRQFNFAQKVRYMPYICYSFERYLTNPVHNDISRICDEEIAGRLSVRKIITVDFTRPLNKDDAYVAYIRDFAVVGGRQGENMEWYEYSGTLRATGKAVKGAAYSNDGWQTCGFKYQQ